MSHSPCTVYLIPCYLYAGATQCLPNYLQDAISQCQVFFVENLRTTRRYFKQLWPQINIDQYEWHAIDEIEVKALPAFTQAVADGKTIGIVSEAGCPGIADPGQLLVAVAQELGATVKPLVGPSSILLALMASGLNGQQFKFAGYLPIETAQRRKAILHLEERALKLEETQIFIETPYRNNALFQDLLNTLRSGAKLC
ncbi:MAG TPA: SAM-dependent methyltransferase, partial [Phnomibacter sp.]|nr:SAM-dependent methyltransferase [Phnomibacter sp.]